MQKCAGPPKQRASKERRRNAVEKTLGEEGHKKGTGGGRLRKVPGNGDGRDECAGDNSVVRLATAGGAKEGSMRRHAPESWVASSQCTWNQHL